MSKRHSGKNKQKVDTNGRTPKNNKSGSISAKLSVI